MVFCAIAFFEMFSESVFSVFIKLLAIILELVNRSPEYDIGSSEKLVNWVVKYPDHSRIDVIRKPVLLALWSSLLFFHMS